MGPWWRRGEVICREAGETSLRGERETSPCDKGESSSPLVEAPTLWNLVSFGPQSRPQLVSEKLQGGETVREWDSKRQKQAACCEHKDPCMHFTQDPLYPAS